MQRRFRDLHRHFFDVLVIGGGINGTGVARDAARRGLRVGLVEKEDFGYGTTGRSTRLIHGGLRYLAMYDFGLVRESLRERERLLENAPHLVRPLTFVVPFYEGQRTPAWMVRLGLILYDALAGGSRVPPHEWLSREETLAAEPGLRAEGLKGGALYGDGQVELVERLCVENALDAAEHGAVLANHARVEDVRPDADGLAVRVRDLLTGESATVRARRVVNTTGPWLDRVKGLERVESRMTKGVHLVTPRSTKHAILLFSPDDDRVFFSVPWLGMELVGTTDTDYRDDPDDVHADAKDVEYLQRGIRFVLPEADVGTVHYAYAGIRNLVPEKGRSESDVSRKHQVIRHEELPGMVSLVGGKITPFRAVCEEVVDLVAPPRAARSDTAEAPLPGAPHDPDALLADLERRAGELRLPPGVARTLAETYGQRAHRVLDPVAKDPMMGEVLCPHAPLLAAEVTFARDEEMARTSADVLLRRTRCGWEPCEGLDAVAAVARILGSDDEAEYRRVVAARHRFSAGG